MKPIKPLSSSRDVKAIRREKEDWIAEGRTVAGARELVERHYKRDAYAELEGKENVFVSVPSTSGRNVLPQALAARLAEDFGGRLEKEPLAYAQAQSQSKHKTSFEQKIVDPVTYRVDAGNVAKLSEAAAGKNIVVVDDVQNTGESQVAFRKTLEAAGVRVECVALLAAADTRAASPRDLTRLSGKISQKLDLDAGAVEPVVGAAFGGHYKQFTNYAERSLTSTRKARLVWDYAQRQDAALRKARRAAQ